MEDIRTGVCPLCRHNRILEAPATVRMELDGAKLAAPLGLGEMEVWAEQGGALTVFACRSCGYAQCFVKNAQAVPLAERNGTRLVTGPEPEGPYR